MADNFTLPGGINGYVPQLHEELMVEFSRNPAAFPLNMYTDIRKVDKQKGLFIRMKNDGQARVINDQDNIWPEGTDSPKQIDGNDEFEFGQYNCVRRRQPRFIGNLFLEQVAWDALGQAGRFLAMQMMTKRVKRVHTTLTTTANWNGNAANASTLVGTGGQNWTNASATNPNIRISLAAAEIAIEKGTLGVVQAEDLYVVCNPNTAKLVATSGEFLDFVKQNPASISIWQGQNQFRRYGLPEEVMGLRWVVDNTVYVSSAIDASTTTQAFTFPDNVAVLMTKKGAIKPAGGGALSTFVLFAQEEFTTEVYNDAENRRHKLYVSECVDDSVIISPSSGYLVTINA